MISQKRLRRMVRELFVGTLSIVAIIFILSIVIDGC